MSNSTAAHARWVDEPDQRGTWAILSTCIVTITLCCWSSVYPNIPPRSASTLKKEMGKVNLFLIGLLSPEMYLPIALGQWSSARASVKRFHEAGYSNWSITHAFFADMGGFLLQSPGSEMFPIDAEQLFWLVKDEFIVYPELDIEDIEDKNFLSGWIVNSSEATCLTLPLTFQIPAYV
ncbi:hypothetical protein N7541_006687 [Penicillium brevicompactum]|uniref:Uncharacterized protein n=1 Tax=Penicillium brevicompactum TaxID=5074 RepID=A0A9W9R5L7_PENBR|nr:hypothetical protein N7541_006687 [Penicillium brevicompactum]